MRLGLLPPQRDHLFEFLRHGGGEVVAFGGVVVGVVQLPGVVVEGDSGFVAGHGFPAVVPESAMPGHLEVLDLFAGGGPSIGKRVGERGSADRDLLETSPHSGRLYMYKVINRGGDVVDVMELPPHPIPYPIPYPIPHPTRPAASRTRARTVSKTGGPVDH